MFSGIIDALGKIARITPADKAPGRGCMLDIQTPYRSLAKGESVAVEGVCLTVIKSKVKNGKSMFTSQVSEESMRKSSLGQAKTGQPVNLERALRLSDRISGHIVQGHVDAVGRLISVAEEVNSKMYTFSYPAHLASYLVPKGSIAVDGISLTVVECSGEQFSVSILPFTEKQTSLHAKQPGSPVNLEADVLCKIVVKQVRELVNNLQKSGEAPEGTEQWQQLMKEEGYL